MEIERAIMNEFGAGFCKKINFLRIAFLFLLVANPATAFSQAFPCTTRTMPRPDWVGFKLMCATPVVSKDYWMLNDTQSWSAVGIPNGYNIIHGHYTSPDQLVSTFQAVGLLRSDCTFHLGNKNYTDYFWNFPIENWQIDEDVLLRPNPALSCVGPYLPTGTGISVPVGKTRTVTCPSGFSGANSNDYLPAPTLGSPITSSPIAQGFENGYLCIKIVPPKFPTCGQGNPVETIGGAKVQPEEDYRTPDGRLTISRLYRSDNTSSLSLIGSGWFLSVHHKLDLSQVSNGIISANLGTGTQKFFFSTDGTAWNTEKYDSDRVTISYGSAGVPDGYLYYSTGEHSVSKYSTTGELLKTVFADGYSLNFTPVATTPPSPGTGYPAAISDSFGRTISFAADADGLISAATIPGGGTIQYTYAGREVETSAAAKNLVQVTYPDGKSRTYVYGESQNISNPALISSVDNLLTGTIDEKGTRLGTFKYAVAADSYTGSFSAKAISTERAGGTNKFVFDRTSGVVTVTDPSGASQSVTSVGLSATFFQGKVLEQGRSQPAGSGCSPSTSNRSYDANGNVAQSDDFNGTRACFANDLNRNLETIRVEGLLNTQDCSSVALRGALLPSGSRMTSTQWHPDWPLQAVRAEPGKLTTMVYNGQPDPFNGGALARCAQAAATLPDGKPIAVLCKQVEQATTDADGSQGLSATVRSDMPKRQSTWTYNLNGQVLVAKGPRTDVNDSTTFSYYTDTTADHTLGDRQSMTDASGKTTVYNRYNPAGQLLQATDSNGVLTINVYDSRQHLLSTTVAGEITTYTYDPAGQLLTITPPNGATVSNTYDDAHRLIQVTDAAGNKVVYTLDGWGNRIGEQVQDASGTMVKNITRSFDALNRLQSVSGAAR